MSGGVMSCFDDNARFILSRFRSGDINDAEAVKEIREHWNAENKTFTALDKLCGEMVEWIELINSDGVIDSELEKEGKQLIHRHEQLEKEEK
jgi:hypothetical protein